MKQELEKSMFLPKVLQIVPTNDYCVYVYFNDGSVRLFNVKPLIQPDTVFEILHDIELFKSRVTVLNDTVAWDINGDRDPRKCIDLDPIVIFEQPAVADPLSAELRVAEHEVPYSSALFASMNN